MTVEAKARIIDAINVFPALLAHGLLFLTYGLTLLLAIVGAGKALPVFIEAVLSLIAYDALFTIAAYLHELILFNKPFEHGMGLYEGVV